MFLAEINLGILLILVLLPLLVVWLLPKRPRNRECPHCKTKMRIDAVVCPNCGRESALDPAAATREP